MNRRLVALCLTGLLSLAGCTAPEDSPEPAPPLPAVEPAAPRAPRPPLPQVRNVPAGAPEVEHHPGRTTIKGVRAEFHWFAGGAWLAVANENGLWAVQARGPALELLAPAGPARTLVGPYREGLVYLEQHPGALVAYLARPGDLPRQVGAVEHPGVEQPGYRFWAAISGARLTVAIEGRRVAGIDLATGRSAPLGDEAVPVYRGELAPDPTGRYLAYKQANRGDAVRLLDLQNGAIFRPADEAQVGSIAWSAGGLWAVREAAPDSGLPIGVGANLEEGGTHLAVGDTKGGLRRLKPPTDLELVDGPWWSADGAYLAVVSGQAANPDALRRLWAVTVESGEWLRLGTLPPGGTVAGFAPFAPSLMVHGSNGLWLWPANGDDMVKVNQPWQPDPDSPLRLEDGSLLYLTAEPAPRLVRQKPEGDPEVIMEMGGPAGHLAVQGRYASLIRYRQGLYHDLLILPLTE